MNPNIERIEQYLLGIMSDSERSEFENELNNSSALREEVTIQREVMNALKTDAAIVDIKNASKVYHAKMLKLKWIKGIGFTVLGAAIITAAVFFMNRKIKEPIINIGTGKDFTIKQYAKILLGIIYPGRKIKIEFDRTKPNGTPRKVLNINLAKRYGWVAKTDIKKAIEITYKDYLNKSN